MAYIRMNTKNNSVIGSFVKIEVLFDMVFIKCYE